MNELKKIIDFRVRPPYKGFLDLSISDPGRTSLTMRGTEAAPSFRNSSMELFLAEMTTAGVERAVVMGRTCGAGLGSVSNDDVAELVAMYPDQFIGFGSVPATPIRGAMQELRRCIEKFAFRGIALDPGGLEPPLCADARELYPCYAACEEAGVPVAIALSVLLGPDLSYSLPIAIDHVARDFPDLPVIVVHGAWPWVMEIIAVAFRRPNVYLLPDFYMHTPGTPGAGHFVEAANDFLGDRLLYGSSYPVRPLGVSRDEFEALALGPEVCAKATGDTARRLLHM